MILKEPVAVMVAPALPYLGVLPNEYVTVLPVGILKKVLMFTGIVLLVIALIPGIIGRVPLAVTNGVIPILKVALIIVKDIGDEKKNLSPFLMKHYCLL
jgi:hypothetical protein